MSDVTVSQDAETAAANVGMAADIVSAYVGHNTVSVTEIPALITEVHAALTGLRVGFETHASLAIRRTRSMTEAA